MPETIAMLVWIVGGAVIIGLLGIVAFFIVRLINGLDLFKTEVTSGLQNLNKSLTFVHDELKGQIGSLNLRVAVVEEAGCKPCKEIKNGK